MVKIIDQTLYEKRDIRKKIRKLEKRAKTGYVPKIPVFPIYAFIEEPVKTGNRPKAKAKKSDWGKKPSYLTIFDTESEEFKEQERLDQLFIEEMAKQYTNLICIYTKKRGITKL